MLTRRRRTRETLFALPFGGCLLCLPLRPQKNSSRLITICQSLVAVQLGSSANLSSWKDISPSDPSRADGPSANASIINPGCASRRQQWITSDECPANRSGHRCSATHCRCSLMTICHSACFRVPTLIPVQTSPRRPLCVLN